MILNPMRNQVEQMMFPDEESVLRFVNTMDQSLEIVLANEASPEVVQRNREYIAQCMTYQTIAESGIDLTPYQAVA